MIPEGRRFASVVSGGVDSSLISYYLLKHSSPETLIAVNHLGKDLISNDLEKFEKILGRKIEIIDVDIATYSAAIPHCQKFLGTPLGSHSFVGQSIQSNYVRAKGCKALFGGEGADELFGGYSCYLDPQRRGNEGKFSPSLYTGKFDPKIKFSENNAELLDQELMSEWQIALKTYEHVENKEQKIAHAMMYCDFAYQLPAVGMRGADLMSMMWSIETRSLFVRRPIVEFGLNLPMNAKSCTDESVAIGERSKRVLKNLFKRVFTKDLLVEKQGFAGFPNESGVYLGDVRDFLALRFLGIDPKQVAPETLNRETAWKLINTEYFLREQQS